MENSFAMRVQRASLLQLLEMLMSICCELKSRLAGSQLLAEPLDPEQGQATSNSPFQEEPRREKQKSHRERACPGVCMHCEKACIRATPGHGHCKCKVRLHWRQ